MAGPARPFIVPVFIPHAGCPHRCVFCNQKAVTGRPAAFPTAAEIRAAIDAFLAFRRDERRPVEISFYGGNFLGLPDERILALLDLARAYVMAGRAGAIRFSTRPDTLDERRLSLIRTYPVGTVELGVQSMQDPVLALCRRGHTADDVRRAAALLRRRPIRLGLQMMIGLPGDSEAGALESAHRIADLAPDFVRIYPTLVLEGSLLSRWHADGRYSPLGLEAAVSLARRVYEVFRGRGIRVVRMGLQPTDELNDGAAVIAGPFHPAFGELVLAEAWFSALSRHIEEAGLAGGDVLIGVHPRAISRLTGHKSRYLRSLIDTFSLTGVRVQPDPALPEDTLTVNGRACRMVAALPAESGDGFGNNAQGSRWSRTRGPASHAISPKGD